MMQKKAAVFLFLLALFHQSFALAPKKEYFTKKTAQEILIDGDLSDEVWQTANWNRGFQMYYPYDNKEASQATKFAIVYDADFMYVAIKAFDDEPQKISKRLIRRDDVDGDYLGISIDSYNDLQTAYCFNVSAAGTKRDYFISGDGSSSDDSWDPIWWVETNITSDGWVAEMKIPFSQLRFVNNYEQTWGIQVERYIQRKEERSLWQSKKRNDPGWVHHFGKMTGLVDIQPKRTFDLYPYAVGSVSTYEKEEGNPFADGTDWNKNVGLDGKIGLTNNLTLDFSINPDFGQVEADPSTINLSGFELFFQEKRPFFIEGKNIINFPLMIGDGNLAWENVFYSRRIGRRPHYYPDLEDGQYTKVPDNTTILGAAKITGRTENGLSIGIMESVTAKEKAKISYNDNETRYETVEPATNYSVVSLQKDFGGGNTILSGMLTSTNRLIEDQQLEFLHTNAYTAGLDFTKFWKDKTWYFTALGTFSLVQGSTEAITQTQESSTHLFQRPDANHLHLDTTRTLLPGYGGNILFGKSGGSPLSFVTAVYFKSPGLELNDVGFVRHVDDIITIFWMGYRINEPFSIFKNVGFNVNHWSTFDFGGNFLGQGGNINMFGTFKNNYEASMGVNVDVQQVSTSHLRGGPSYRFPANNSQWFYLGSDSRKKMSVSFSSSFGSGAEHYYQRQSYEVELTYKPINSLEIGLSPNYSQIHNTQQYVETVEDDGITRYVLGTLDQEILGASLRINWNLTPDFSIQYWGQPFFATGSYGAFKRVTDAGNAEYNKRFEVLNTILDETDPDNILWQVDENNDGTSDYHFNMPDFNTKVFLSNLVARWEYRPGSVLFLVWSQNREHFNSDATQTYAQNVSDMFDFKPHNTFLLKLSYRIGI